MSRDPKDEPTITTSNTGTRVVHDPQCTHDWQPFHGPIWMVVPHGHCVVSCAKCGAVATRPARYADPHRPIKLTEPFDKLKISDYGDGDYRSGLRVTC